MSSSHQHQLTRKLTAHTGVFTAETYQGSHLPPSAFQRTMMLKNNNNANIANRGSTNHHGLSGSSSSSRPYTPEAERLLAQLCGTDSPMYNLPRHFTPPVPRPSTSLGLTSVPKTTASLNATPVTKTKTQNRRAASARRRGDETNAPRPATPQANDGLAASVQAYAAREGAGALQVEHLERLREGAYLTVPDDGEYARRPVTASTSGDDIGRPLPLSSTLRSLTHEKSDTRNADAARIGVPPRLGDWLNSWERRFTPTPKSEGRRRKPRHGAAAAAVQVREWSEARLNQLDADVADMEYMAYRPIDDELSAVSMELAEDPGPAMSSLDGSDMALANTMPSETAVFDRSVLTEETRQRHEVTAAALQQSWSNLQTIHGRKKIATTQGFESLKRYAELAGANRATAGGASGLAMLDAIIAERRRLIAATLAELDMPNRSTIAGDGRTRPVPPHLAARIESIEEAREAKDVLEAAGMDNGTLRITDGRDEAVGAPIMSREISTMRASIEQPHPGAFDAERIDECLGALHTAQLAVARRAPELARSTAAAIHEMCRCLEDLSHYCARTEGDGSPHMAVLRCAVDSLGDATMERDDVRKKKDDATERVATLEEEAEASRSRERELNDRVHTLEKHNAELERESEKTAIRLKRAEEHVAELSRGKTTAQLKAEIEDLQDALRQASRRGKIPLSEMTDRELELYNARTKMMQCATGEGQCADPRAIPPPPLPPPPVEKKGKKKRGTSGRKGKK
ncbi:hypothetical protein NFJ02_19g32860 [Pycnococcus provasolii]